MGLAGELGLGIGDCGRGLVTGGVDDVGRSSVGISWAFLSTSVGRTLGAARMALAVPAAGARNRRSRSIGFNSRLRAPLAKLARSHAQAVVTGALADVHRHHAVADHFHHDLRVVAFPVLKGRREMARLAWYGAEVLT